MKPVCTIAPDWRDEPCFIVAGGVSVERCDLSRLKGHRVIVVNSSYEAVPFADLLYFADVRWWREHKDRPKLKAFQGRIITVSQLAEGEHLLRLHRVKPDGKIGLALRPDSAVTHRTSLQGAINIAFHKGANPIILVGADMCRAPDGRTHHHSPHPWRNKPGNRTWDIQLKQLALVVEPLRERGVQVINVSPVSRIPESWGWTRMSFNAALERYPMKKAPRPERRKDGYAGGIMFDDEAAITAIVAELGAKSVLEFGPGASTAIFLDAGVRRVVSCEHEPRYLERARGMFGADKRVMVLPYANTPEAVANLGDQTFDLAFVDSPQGYKGARVEHPGQEGLSRYNTLRLALNHAPHVLLHDALRPFEQASLQRIEKQGLATVEMIRTHKGLAWLRRKEKAATAGGAVAVSVVFMFWKGNRRSWQKGYSHNVVNTLARSVSRNLSVPHEVVVFTDQPAKGFDSNIRVVSLPHPEIIAIGNAYPKLFLFSRDVPLARRILFLDLDTVITGSLDDIVNRPEPIVFIPEFLRSERHCHYNSSVMLLTRGAAPHVWDDFIANPAAAHKKVRASHLIGSDQVWLSMKFGPSMPTWEPGKMILSYKYEVRGNRWLPDNARIVCFHGQFKPWDLDVQAANPWIKDHFR